MSKNSFRSLCQKFEISLARLVSDFSGKKRGIAGYCFVLLPPLHRVSNECVSGCTLHRRRGRKVGARDLNKAEAQVAGIGDCNNAEAQVAGIGDCNNGEAH